MRHPEFSSPSVPQVTPRPLALARETAARQKPSTPILYFCEATLRDNAQRFRAALPSVTAHYAIKANPHPRVLSVLAEEDINFEIASQAELELLINQGVDTSQVFFSNPIKSPAHLRFATQHGVEWYVVDSVAEVQKIASIVPAAKLYLRLSTSNAGAVLPLADKFGSDLDDSHAIIQACLDHHMQLAGVSFHVGSQCLDANSWRNAINDAQICFSYMRGKGFNPELLNLGGGYPTEINSCVSSIESIGAAIEDELKKLDPSIKVIAEPGRFMVASAGWLSTQVVGTAVRRGHHWLYLDTGFYGGLMELTDHYALPIHSEREGPFRPWTIAGPTCDSIDTLSQACNLPENLQADDRLFIGHLGAYCYACTTEFNGFPAPSIQFV